MVSVYQCVMEVHLLAVPRTGLGTGPRSQELRSAFKSSGEFSGCYGMSIDMIGGLEREYQAVIERNTYIGSNCILLIQGDSPQLRVAAETE